LHLTVTLHVHSFEQVQINSQGPSRIKELTKQEEANKRRIGELLKVEGEYQERIRELEQEIVDTQGFYNNELDEYKMKVEGIYLISIIIYCL
jgi:hypothetical protein